MACNNAVGLAQWSKRARGIRPSFSGVSYLSTTPLPCSWSHRRSDIQCCSFLRSHLMDKRTVQKQENSSGHAITGIGTLNVSSLQSCLQSTITQGMTFILDCLIFPALSAERVHAIIFSNLECLILNSCLQSTIMQHTNSNLTDHHPCIGIPTHHTQYGVSLQYGFRSGLQSMLVDPLHLRNNRKSILN